MRYTSSIVLLAALVACSLGPPDTGSLPAVAVTPAHHDFGALVVGATDAMRVRIANRGDAPLDITGLAFEAGSELVLDTLEADNGPLPWSLDPGRAREVSVLYAPSDTVADVSELRVASTDPVVPVAIADQAGRARPFEDFAELAAWVRARAGGPTPVTGPLDLRTTSTVPRLQGASFLRDGVLVGT